MTTLQNNPALESFLAIMRERTGVSKIEPAPTVAEAIQSTQTIKAWRKAIKKSAAALPNQPRKTAKQNRSESSQLARDEHVKRSDARRAEARAYVQGLPPDAERPERKRVARMFHICDEAAGEIISERYGAFNRNEIVAWVNAQTERPTDFAAIAERFGVCLVYAQALVRQKFGKKDRMILRNTAAEWVLQNPNATAQETADHFGHSGEWASAVRKAARVLADERGIDVSKFGFSRSGRHREGMAAANAWLDQQTEKPKAREIFQRFDVGLGWAKKMVLTKYWQERQDRKREVAR